MEMELLQIGKQSGSSTLNVSVISEVKYILQFITPFFCGAEIQSVMLLLIVGN
jgi:hypothetical protein